MSWAAGNGDRSENGDYLYGKKRLREIVKRKAKGQTIEVPDDEDEKPTPVPDLMAALEQSLEEAKSR